MLDWCLVRCPSVVVVEAEVEWKVYKTDEVHSQSVVDLQTSADVQSPTDDLAY